MSLLSTTRSVIFDTKLRFEIGRYELRSRGSSNGFLRIGRVTALFWLTGNVHCAKEALHMRAITGAMITSTFLTSHVGAGSRLQCFEGAFLRRRITSSTVTGSNAIRGSGTDRCVISGGGEPTVDDQILATLSAKNAAKSSAEWSAIVFASGCYVYFCNSIGDCYEALIRAKKGKIAWLD